jgi:hypothetical protein
MEATPNDQSRHQHSANAYSRQGTDSSDIHTKGNSGINAKIAADEIMQM